LRVPYNLANKIILNYLKNPKRAAKGSRATLTVGLQMIYVTSASTETTFQQDPLLQQSLMKDKVTLRKACFSPSFFPLRFKKKSEDTTTYTVREH